jgi:hypothetical protein
MYRKLTTNKDIYIAIAYTLMLVAFTIPLSTITMEMLNLLLGNIKV